MTRCANRGTDCGSSGLNWLRGAAVLTAALAVTLGSSPAWTARPTPPPPPTPPTPGTIYYKAGGLLYGMQSDGTGTTPVPNGLGAPSSRVYGDDPVLDRWWLTILEIPGQPYPGFPDFNRREVFAIRPYWENGEQQFEQVQVSNFFPYFNPQKAQWSNGGDSFISLHAYDVPNQILWVARIDVSGADIEVAAAQGIDPLVGPEEIGFFVSGPGYEGNFQHDWDPSGSRVAYSANITYPANNAEFSIIVYDPETGQHRRIEETGRFTDVPRWSPDGSSILSDGSYGGSLKLINPEYDLDDPGDVEPGTVFKQGTWKKSYNNAAWSPDGSQLVFSVANLKGNTWTQTMVRAALADGNEVNLGLGGDVTPMAWLSNLPGGP